MVMLALSTEVSDSEAFADAEFNLKAFGDAELMVAETRRFTVLDQHLIKVTACWRSMSSDQPAVVTLSITDGQNAHIQEQSHRIDTANVGQAGGEMSRVLRVRQSGGDIKPGSHSFKLRAVRTVGFGTIVIQAAKKYPTEIRVEDLGVIPPHQL